MSDCLDDAAYDAGDDEYLAKVAAAGITLEQGAEIIHGLMAAGLDPDDPTWQTPLPPRAD